MVARQAHNLEVVGSNPAPATKLNSCNQIKYKISRDRAVVARQAHNLEVVGSNPAPATIFYGEIAQSVEQWIENPRVDSSILSLTTMLKVLR